MGSPTIRSFQTSQGQTAHNKTGTLRRVAGAGVPDRLNINSTLKGKYHENLWLSAQSHPQEHRLLLHPPGKYPHPADSRHWVVPGAALPAHRRHLDSLLMGAMGNRRSVIGNGEE